MLCVGLIGTDAFPSGGGERKEKQLKTYKNVKMTEAFGLGWEICEPWSSGEVYCPKKFEDIDEIMKILMVEKHKQKWVAKRLESSGGIS